VEFLGRKGRISAASAIRPGSCTRCKKPTGILRSYLARYFDRSRSSPEQRGLRPRKRGEGGGQLSRERDHRKVPDRDETRVNPNPKFQRKQWCQGRTMRKTLATTKDSPGRQVNRLARRHDLPGGGGGRPHGAYEKKREWRGCVLASGLTEAEQCGVREQPLRGREHETPRRTRGR